jgi:hypothetical protein
MNPLYKTLLKKHLLPAAVFAVFAGNIFAQTVFPNANGFILPPGKSAYLTYDVDVNANACPVGTVPPANLTNQASVSGSNFPTVLTDDPDVPGGTNPTVTPFGASTVGNLVYKDINRDGDYDPGVDEGVNGVVLKLYVDTGNGVLDGADNLVATTTTATVGGQPGTYSFIACPGNYAISVEPTNFGSGGALYDNTLNTSLISSPLGGAPDPDSDSVDGDDNGDPIPGFGVGTAVFAITGDNPTIDFGFKTPTTISIGDVAMAEGTGAGSTTFTFTVTRSSDEETFSVNVGTANSTAIAGSDYVTLTGGMVSFTAFGPNTATVNVTVLRDNVVEANESFLAALTGQPSYIYVLDGIASGVIQNDDQATLTLTGGNTVVEGNTGTTTFNFNVAIDLPVQGGFSIAYSANDSTATTADGDYTDNDGTLVFSGLANESKAFSITSNGDTKVEGNEIFTAVLGAISGTNAGAGITKAGTPRYCVLTNDDTATLTLSGGATQTEGNSGTVAYTFTATLSNEVQDGFQIAYSTNDGAATAADGDYTDNDGTLTFAGTTGEIQTVTVLVNGDTKVEPNENFTVALGAFSMITAVQEAAITKTGSPQTGNITNDDSAVITLTGGSAQAEGTGGTTTYTFTATLSHAVQGGFNIAYSTNDGTATAADGDYTDNDGTLAFTGTANEAKTITVTYGTDTKVEPDESFTVSLGAITGTALGASLSLGGSPQTSTANNDDSAVITLTGGAAQNEANSGTSSFAFFATLSADVQGGFNLAYTTNDGTATVADNDYADNDASLAFAGTANEVQFIIVEVNGDTKVEANETFSVALGAISGTMLGASLSLAGSPRAGTITNDDTAVITLSGGATNHEGHTGTTIYTFQAVLSAAVQDGFHIAYAANDGSATVADNDYTDNDGSLIFTGTANEMKTIQVSVNGDTKVEANETFTFSLGAISMTTPTQQAAISLAGSPQLNTINNDDSAVITLSGGMAQNESHTGAVAYTFTATLSAPVQDGFQIAYATNDGTATAADNDYSDNDGSLTFTGTANEMKTVTVLVNGDTKVEADEQFTVALGAISMTTPVQLAALSTAASPQTGTITNDDSAVITLTGGVSKNEGNAGLTTYTFTATLSADVQGGFDVAYTTDDGSATTADGDYTDNDGTLSFTGIANEAKTITVLFMGDTKVEPNESFTVNLGTISGTALSSSLSIMGVPQAGTANNDDSAVITLSGGITQNEGNTGVTAYTFAATLSASVQGGFNLAYATNDGTATVADGDYTDNDGSLAFTGLANEVKMITVNVAGDTKVEIHEDFTVALGAISGTTLGALLSITGSPQTGTITNDDSAVITLTGGASQTEGNTGTKTYTFTATASAAVQGGFNVAYTTNDVTATAADNDYLDNDGSLVFIGLTNEAKTIQVTVNGDTKVESNEIFTVSLGAISGTTAIQLAALSTANSPQTGTITNDDSAIITLTGGATQLEGHSGATAYTFTATLSAAVQGGFNLAYTTNDGSATLADGDYLDNDGSLSFTGTANEAKTIIVNVNGDTKVEPNETFFVALGAISGTALGASLSTTGSPQAGTVTNDDSAVITLSGGIAQNEGNAGTTAFTFTATLSAAVQGGLTVAYATSEGTATIADNDFADNDGSLTFTGAANEAKTITVQVTGDTKVEDNETFAVELGAISGTSLGASLSIVGSPQTGTISNDDSAVVTLSGGIAQNEGNAGTTAYTFTATLDAAVQGGFNLAYTANDGSATVADSDYTDNDGTLAFTGTANEAKTITVLVHGDTKVEANETFTLSLGAFSMTSPVQLAALSTADSPQSGTITNDDSAVVTLSGGVAQNEGHTGATNFVFTATLSAAVQGGFDVAYATTDITAMAADNDYSDNDAALSFTGLENETQTITVAVTGDTKVEAHENFTVELGAILGTPLGASISIANSPQTGTITNDDNAVITLSGGIAQVEGNAGTVTHTFTATSDAAVQGGFAIAYATNNGTATTADGDYTDNDGSLTFTGSPNEMHSFSVTTYGDSKVEDHETFTVTLGAVSMTTPVQMAAISTASSPQTGTITNDDTATLTLSGGTTKVEGNAGFTNYSFTVKLTGVVQDGFQVAFNTNDGTATAAGNDYVDNDPTLVFDGTDQETKTVVVQVVGDGLVEPTEDFTTSLGSFSATSAVQAAAIAVTGSPQMNGITDDETDYGDAPASYSTLLANNGPRHPGIPGIHLGASIDGEIDGQPGPGNGDDTDTEGNDDDGVTLPSPLVAAALTTVVVHASTIGYLNAFVDINRDGDFADPFEQIFSNQPVVAGVNTLSFTMPSSITQGTSYARFRFNTVGGLSYNGFSPDGGEVEDYQVELVNTQYSVNDPVVTEGNTGTVNLGFVISRTNNNGSGSVDYAITGGTASDLDTDYQPLTSGTIIFTSGGDLSQTINVVVNGDLKVELDETVEFTLSNAVGGNLLDGMGVGMVENDDAATLSISSPMMPEGDEGMANLVFEVSMNHPSDADVVFNFASADGTATQADLDYQNTAGTHTLTPGQLTKQINVPVLGDCNIETDEDFTVVLSALNANGRDITFSSSAATLEATGTIENDDAQPMLTCPADYVRNTGAGVCDASVTLTLPMTANLCGSSTLEFRYRPVDMANMPTGPFSPFESAVNNTVVFAKGKYEIEWRVTDASGVMVCSHYIIIADIEAPVALCKNITVQLDANGTAVITPAQVDNGSSDNCSVVLSVNIANFSCADIGANTVTLTATDPGNLTHTCTAVVTVQDLVVPSALCKNAIVHLDAAGNGSITAGQVDNGTNDACGIATLSVSPLNFTCANTGSNTVTLTATDVNGNVATCAATVTVQDQVAPIARCKNRNVTLDPTGNAMISADQLDDGSTDACGIQSLSISLSHLTCSHIGTNTVTLTVQDWSNNLATCTSVVTVAPFITISSIEVTPASCGVNNGTIVIHATSLGGQLVYSINNGSTFQPSNTFTGLQGGNYPVVVQALNTTGCTASGGPASVNTASAVNTWTGGGGNQLWSDRLNWSDFLVPLACQDVVIPAGMTVRVPAGFNAVGKTLDVVTGADIFVEPTGVLTIQN